MPFKKVRGETDAISRDNCTYYWPSNSDDGWPAYPGYEKPFYGVTGVISGCGDRRNCPPGYETHVDVDGEFTRHLGGQFGNNVDVGTVIGAGNENNKWTPIQVSGISGVSNTQCGDICKIRNTKQGENDCSCFGLRNHRRICKRTSEFTGDWKKCCLESDANKLVEMDCPPEYFATNDGSEKVSLKCKEELESFCKEKPAYDKDNKEAPINSEYLELCGCNYPDEYYNSIRDDITKDFPNVTGAELGHMGCFAPTCVIGASDFVKPVMKNNCPTNNFLSCINTINLDVGGDIKGEVVINQSNECNIFQEDGVGDNIPPIDPGTKDDKKNGEDGEDDESFLSSLGIEDNDTNNTIMWLLIIGVPICCLILLGLFMVIASSQ